MASSSSEKEAPRTSSRTPPPPTTKEEEETLLSKEKNNNATTTRIDAPSFIFAVVFTCLVMFSVVFGAFVKVPTIRRSAYDRTQKITSAHDVHFAHAHHLHHHHSYDDHPNGDALENDDEEEQGV